jgi:16S rRNA C1402 (ribose-2'-O) methylase RsmI
MCFTLKKKSREYYVTVICNELHITIFQETKSRFRKLLRSCVYWFPGKNINMTVQITRELKAEVINRLNIYNRKYRL